MGSPFTEIILVGQDSLNVLAKSRESRGEIAVIEHLCVCEQLRVDDVRVRVPAAAVAKHDRPQGW